MVFYAYLLVLLGDSRGFGGTWARKAIEYLEINELILGDFEQKNPERKLDNGGLAYDMSE